MSHLENYSRIDDVPYQESTFLRICTQSLAKNEPSCMVQGSGANFKKKKKKKRKEKKWKRRRKETRRKGGRKEKKEGEKKGLRRSPVRPLVDAIFA
jgi:hypothetical protein